MNMTKREKRGLISSHGRARRNLRMFMARNPQRGFIRAGGGLNIREAWGEAREKGFVCNVTQEGIELY